MATIAAECSRALTGLGPSMARESQNEKGSWAALPSAATRMPATITSRQPAPPPVPMPIPTSVPEPAAAPRSPSESPTPAATAAPAAR